MSIIGLQAFRQQAETATSYFTERTQTIKSLTQLDNSIEVEILYHAVLNMDFPNGLKKGQELNLSGKSIFVFEGDRIIKLTDIS
jgi:hypothetical protein